MVEISPGLTITQWATREVFLDPMGTPLTPLLPLKIAYEYLACHLGAAIYGSEPALESIRGSLSTEVLDKSIAVEALSAEREDPLHRLVLESCAPHVRVQIRLFGTMAYRVHLKAIRTSGPRFVYTHMLATNEEGVVPVQDHTAPGLTPGSANTPDAGSHGRGR
jgi:hypothetical protein